MNVVTLVMLGIKVLSETFVILVGSLSAYYFNEGREHEFESILEYSLIFLDLADVQNRILPLWLGFIILYIIMNFSKQLGGKESDLESKTHYTTSFNENNAVNYN